MKKLTRLMTLLLVLLVLPVFGQPAFDDEGLFLYVLNEEIVAEENFTFTSLENGNTLLESVFILLSEEFLVEFETDRLFDQTLELTDELALVNYSLASNTARGNFSVEVAVDGDIALMSFSSTDAETEETTSGEQDVILEDNAIASGVSGSGSQLAVLQQLIFLRNITEPTTLLALNPTDLFNPIVEVDIEPLSDAEVTDGVNTFTVQRFSVSQLLDGEGGDTFTVELLSLDGRMIAYQAFSQTSTLLVYRADLYPDGIEMVAE